MPSLLRNVSPRIALILLHVLLPTLSLAGLVGLLQVTWGLALSPPGLLALLAGTVVVYTGERVFERHAEYGHRLVRILLVIGAVAALALLAVVLRHPHRLLPVVVPLAALSLAYPPLARIPVAKELAVTVCWTVGVVVLPFGREHVRWDLLAEPAAWAVAMAVLGATLLCDCKDEEADRARGVGALPVLLGGPWTRLIAAAAALDAVWLAWWGQAYGLLPTAFLLVYLATRDDVLRQPQIGPIAVDASLALAGAVAWAGTVV